MRRTLHFLCLSAALFCIVSLVAAAAGGAPVVTQYTYDSAGRLLTADDGTTLLTYTYDPLGNLLARTDEVSPVPEPSAIALAVAALLTLTALRRRRGRAALMTVFALAMVPTADAQMTKTVCGMGCDFSSITAALTDPMSMTDDIVVMPGDYNEGNLVVFGRNLSSNTPNDPSNVTIDATGLDQPVIAVASNTTISGLTISGGNNSVSTGGGIRAGGGVTLQSLLIENNTAINSGGGVGSDTSGSLVITDCTIKDNTAGMAGGGIFGPTSTIITGSTIEGNRLNGSLGTRGAGIATMPFAMLEISNSTVTGNIAEGTLTNSGGGISMGSGGFLQLLDVTVTGNMALSATSFGGGIDVGGASVTILGGKISLNSAENGGGAYLAGSGIFLLDGVDISGNIAGVGGGILCGSPGIISSFSGSVQGNAVGDIVNCGDLSPFGGSSADDPDSADGGDPVNTFTGEYYKDYPPDLDLGGPMPLAFRRYSSSGLLDAGITGDLGNNWRHGFSWTLARTGDEIDIVSDRGRVIPFTKTAGVWNPSATSDVAFELTELGSVYTLVDPKADLLYLFNTNGMLTSIEDGKGNVHTLSYDTSARLSQVSDGLGRMLAFTYEAGGRIASVSDGLRMVSFAYTVDDLTRFTDARGNDTIYGYTPADSRLKSETRPEGNDPFSQTYTPDAARKVATQFDAFGNTHSFSYNGLDTTLTDPLGQVQVHTHASSGDFTNFQDEANRSFSLGSDASGRRNQITDRLGDSTAYSYHAPSSKLASVTDAEGNVTNFGYTSRTAGDATVWDLTSIAYSDASSDAFVFDGNGHLVSHSDRRGSTASFTHNASGQPLVATNPLGGQTTNTYHPDGTLASTTDNAANLTTHVYDLSGRLMQTTRPDLTTRSFSYDNADNLLQVTDENGNTDSATFDGNGRVTTLTDSLGDTSTFSWDLNDRLIGTTDPLFASDSRSYDTLGRLSGTTDANGNTTALARDILGRVVTITDPLGGTSQFSYDDEAVLASVTNRLGRTTSFASDKLGRTTQLTSSLGAVTSLGFDSMGKLVSRTNALGDTTTTTRDPSGLVSGMSLPGGAIDTSYTRNGLGEITSALDPNAQLWQYSYDPRGFRTSSTDPLARQEVVSYDTRSRPTRVVFPAALGMVDFTYDAVGNLSSLDFSDATLLSFGYDANDRLTSGDGLALQYDANGLISDSNGLAITRDAGGRISEILYAPGKAITYVYDANDNVVQLLDWAGGMLGLAYDAEDQLISITRDNGVDTTQTWDDDQRLATISESGISSISLVRDAEGQITSATRDLAGNSLLAGAIPAPAAYDAASQVSADSYDALGRLTADGSRALTWDLATRLTTLVEGIDTVTFGYDALNNRVTRSEGGITRDYVLNYAIEPVAVAVEQEQSSDLYYYIHLPSGELLYRVDAVSNARDFYHYDETGNTIAITNDAGAVIATYAYSPYGQLAGSSGGLDNAFMWQGRFGVMSESSDLYYMRARYYDVRTARFVSKDPILQLGPRDINPYGYAHANPLRFHDPLGTDPEPVKEPEKPHQDLEEILSIFIPSGVSVILKELQATKDRLNGKTEPCADELQEQVNAHRVTADRLQELAELDVAQRERRIERLRARYGISSVYSLLIDNPTLTGKSLLQYLAEVQRSEAEAYSARARAARAQGKCGLPQSVREAVVDKDPDPPEPEIESVIPELRFFIVL